MNAQQLGETDFEVQLKLEALGRRRGKHPFQSSEVIYCGAFRLINIPQEQVHPVS